MIGLGRVMQKTFPISIPMGTNCVTHVADLMMPTSYRAFLENANLWFYVPL